MKNSRQSKQPASKPSGLLAFLVQNRQLFYAIAIWAIYMTLFFVFKHNITPKYYIYSVWDDSIPFVKWFFPIYCLWYLYLFVPLLYLYFASKPDFIKLQSYIFIGFFICVFFYALYPNAIDFRPLITGNDLMSRTMNAMFSVDPSNMVTPSMHVFAAVAMHLGLVKCEKTNGKRWLLTLSFVLMILICASTVLVKQHSVIDIFWGILLALALYFPIYGFPKRKAVK